MYIIKITIITILTILILCFTSLYTSTDKEWLLERAEKKMEKTRV